MMESGLPRCLNAGIVQKWDGLGKWEPLLRMTNKKKGSIRLSLEEESHTMWGKRKLPESDSPVCGPSPVVHAMSQGK